MPTEKRVPSLIVNTLTEEQYQALENPSDTEMWVTPYDESVLPDQTGKSGKFLTTDGTDASWADVDTLPSQTGQSGKFLTTDGTDASWASVSSPANVYTQDNLIAGTGISFTNASTITNYTVVGSPTITDGVASGFSDSNYLKATNALNNVTSSFTLQTAINLTALSNENFGIIDTEGTATGIRLTTNASNGIRLRVSTTGTSSTYSVDISSTNHLTLNTKTFIRVNYNSSTGYELLMQEEGEPWTLQATSSVTTKPYSQASDLRIGDNTASGYAFTGSIYLGDTYIDVDGSRAWTAYKTGNFTRVDNTYNHNNFLQNTATGTNSLTVLGTAATNSRAINIGATSVAVSQGTSIGYGSRAHTYSVAVGDNAYTYEEYATAIGQGATCTARASVALGSYANSRNGSQNVAIGSSSGTGYNVSNGTAVGYSAQAQVSGATAIGYNAIAGNSYSIQLGYGTNSTANTLSVGLSTSNNYQLLDSTGTIPSARLPIATTSAVGGVKVDGSTITTNSSDQIQTIGVIDQNDTTKAIKTWTGTKAQYDAIATKDADTIYTTTDEAGDSTEFTDTSLSNITDAGKIVGAGLGMPSNVHTSLSIGASGATYTAPSNGYFYVGWTPTGIGGWVVIYNTRSGMDQNAIIRSPGSGSAWWTRSIAKCFKGDVVNISYADCSIDFFSFVYAEGSKSEAN